MNQDKLRDDRPPLNIALLTYSTKLRGSVVHTLELGEALHDLGHHVCIYALSKDGSGFDYPSRCSVRLIPTQPAPADIDALIHQRIQEFVNYLSNHLLEHGIYHAQDCLSANALVALRQQGQIDRLIRTVHHIEDYKSPYLQECQERSILEADLRVCVSDRWQQELKTRYSINAPRVINGINIHRFSSIPSGLESELKQRWQLNGSPLYLTVGGIEPRKNSYRLLQAFALLKKTLSAAQLIIAGGETLFDYQPYRDECLTLAHDLGLTIGEDVIVTGSIAAEELPALYRLADAFVFPSLKEGWGMVLLEAIASGLPVITANQPPFTEFLSDQSALLVNPYSFEAIAQAMLEVCWPNRARSLVAESQSVLLRYTWETSARLHLEQYYRLLEQHQPFTVNP
jgi:glycosyltransferase-like protein